MLAFAIIKVKQRWIFENVHHYHRPTFLEPDKSKRKYTNRIGNWNILEILKAGK